MLTTKPKKRPSSVDATAPHTGEPPQKGPSGLRFRRLSKKRQTENAKAAPSGSVGSAAADCHPALQPGAEVEEASRRQQGTGSSDEPGQAGEPSSGAMRKILLRKLHVSNQHRATTGAAHVRSPEPQGSKYGAVVHDGRARHGRLQPLYDGADEAPGLHAAAERLQPGASRARGARQAPCTWQWRTKSSPAASVLRPVRGGRKP